MAEDDSELQRCSEQWLTLLREGVTLAALQAFYARYKYLIMSRHAASYRDIGALLATAERKDLSVTAQRFFALMVQALSQPATRGGDVNALLHISGYLKKRLAAEEKQALLDAIERYRRGEIAFEVLAALLRAQFQRFPDPYIQQQVFLYPSGLE